MNSKLRFREDGTFKIVQFTDIHWKDGNEEDQRSRTLMERVLTEEQPDLAVFTGDTIFTGASDPGEAVCCDPRQALRDAVLAVEARGIPWAYVFGNHDTEQGITREELWSEVLKQPHSLSAASWGDQFGPGNYKLEIGDSKGQTKAALYLFDSGNRSPVPWIDGYGWITRPQIDWFAGNAAALPRLEGGAAVPILAFLHIPLPEYKELWETQVCYGYKHEQVCCPPVNSGLFAAMAGTGQVLGVFAGHDHINDYWGVLHGIRLCYGRATGYHTYGREGFHRGARLILLREGASSFDTWLRLADGTRVREQPLHQPSPVAP